MLNISTKSIAALLLSAASLNPASGFTLTEEPDWEAFDHYVADAAREWRVPGLAVAVVKDGQTVFARGYGTTSIQHGTKVDADTLFSIGSTTKAIAAAGIGMLVDDGKIAWDDPVVQHLPQFRLADAEASKRIRVRDLLTHNAGVPNTDVLWYEQPNTLDEILDRMQHVDLYAPMYRDFTYQNVMYATAGKLTEVMSGQPWHRFVESRVFAPLGMERSVALLESTAERTNVAQPHYVIDGDVTLIENASVDAVAAAGSIWSSVREMAQWAKFLLRGCKTEDGTALLRSSTCAELFKPHAIIHREMYPAMRLYDHQWFTYALGWFQTDYNSRALNFHSGSIDGMVALHGLVRNENLGVYILGNLDHAEVRHALMYRALDLYDKSLTAETRRDWNREIKKLFDGLAAMQEANRAANEPADNEQSLRPALANSAYVGTYVDPYFGSVTVTDSDGSLWLRYGRLTCELAHSGGDTFDCRWQTRWRGSAPIQFIPENEQSAGSVRLGGTEFARSK